MSWGPRRTVELLRDGLIEGDTLLEVGGGIGDLQVELLKVGVDRAISIELSPSYENKAAELLLDAGLEGRVTRLIGDFVTLADQVEPADLVVMHSVICCYPDVEDLVGAAAGKAKRYLVATYPPDTWWARSIAVMQNAWYEHVRRSPFRFFIHSPAHIHAAAQAGGLNLRHEETRLADHLAVFERLG